MRASGTTRAGSRGATTDADGGISSPPCVSHISACMYNRQDYILWLRSSLLTCFCVRSWRGTPTFSVRLPSSTCRRQTQDAKNHSASFLHCIGRQGTQSNQQIAKTTDCRNSGDGTRTLSVCVLVRGPVDNCETIQTTSSTKFTSSRCCASSDGAVCAPGSRPTNWCGAQGRSRSTDPILYARL